MKRFLLTLMIGTCVISASAQKGKGLVSVRTSMPSQAQVSLVNKAPAVSTADAVPSTPMTPQELFKARQKRAKEVSNVDAFYALPSGYFLWGMTADFGAYSSLIVETPALMDLTFTNYSSWNTELEEAPVFDWQTYNKQLDVDEDGNGIGRNYGSDYVPLLTVTQAGDTATYNVATNAGARGFWYAGSDGQLTLSAASYAWGMYGGYKAGMRHQTDSTHINTGGEDTGKKVVGFAQYITAPQDVIYVTDISIIGWIEENFEGKILPSDAELKASIYTFDEEGYLSEEPYAVAVAKASDVVLASAEYGSTGITFKFLEEDELLGEVESPIVLPEQDAIVILTGFDKFNTSFTAAFAGDDGLGGNAYNLLEDGSLACVGYSNAPNIPQDNLHISFSAYAPVAKFNDEIEIPAEGGYAVAYEGEEGEDDSYTFYISTNAHYDEWILVEQPEWLTFEAVETEANDEGTEEDLVDKYGVLGAKFSAEALPEGIEGREGDIVFDVYGKELVIHVIQGEVEEENPYDLNHDGKISAGDIQIIINEMKKAAEEQDLKYDLNGDGKISAGDIQIIINEMKKG